jgi:DNA-binding response OmpR family regulator
VPVITTGHASDKIDPVIGFEIGADDYLRKPFGLRELLARIRAILRRTPETRSAATQDVRFGRYRFSGWQLCERTRHLTNPSGNRVFLSNGEFTLLVAFLGAPQRPLSRLALWQATRVHVGASDRSMDVQILRLRRKLTTDRDAPCLIRTERGFGYVFDSPVERVEYGSLRSIK